MNGSCTKHRVRALSSSTWLFQCSEITYVYPLLVQSSRTLNETSWWIVPVLFQHCIGCAFFFVFVFYKSYLFYYFCRRLLILLYFCIFKNFFTFCSPKCAYCCPQNVWLWRKRNTLKSPHFLLRRKHLAFIYLCMENTWYFIPFCIWLCRASPQRCYKTWI